MDPETKSTKLSNRHLEVIVSELGAELISLRDAAGHEYLWSGSAAIWKGRAPILFPIVGKMPDNQMIIDGNIYSISQHGFARNSNFLCVGQSKTSCSYMLASSPTLLETYPFPFRLTIRYVLTERTIGIQASVENLGSDKMPFSFGFHPALRWPLPGGGKKDDHLIVFSELETAPIRRLRSGLMRAGSAPTPIVGRRLPLHEALFAEDVVILEKLQSRSLQYRSPDGPAITMHFPHMPHLGLWSKAGGDFVCIEPWQGYAAPEGYNGEFADKPGNVSLMPGSRCTFSINLEITKQNGAEAG